MRHLSRSICLLLVSTGCAFAATPAEPAPGGGPVLVIHGGAGVVRGSLSAAEQTAARQALAAALREGHALLQAGRPALDAVVAAITVLEDDPAFNAGRGAVFTHEGVNELDASLMDGTTRAAGAVAGVRRIRNPIQLARRVMEDSPHVMLMGEGAERFAQAQGVGFEDPAWFRTEKRWQQLEKARADADAARNAQATRTHDPLRYFGTVGAVALDTGGGLAAGTSTGGMTDKRWGRIGDAPVIGAGTWADGGCAVSGTGWGEFYLRSAAAHAVCSRVSLLGEDIGTAAATVINRDIPALGGNGGAIALASDGRFALPFNTEGMYRGWIGADGIAHVAIGPDDVAAMAPDGADR
ncbi:isoaspartyl peptidase/L-asparaginase family protein [Luteimonas deserti]|uniref:Isoaspartyl peptidase n=1 Tax=Luteimonas deserti TaxID=2752306 RepID=A0A7Z0QN41_9GAMM|nr:isoaspartyl peptidase/L-asparaginase [Luteimonas deserti]NYZ61692.1 isoaspartyl peptidase/L-asparaginase [Luteimonas deserti]